jgi:hypothetical protein
VAGLHKNNLAFDGLLCRESRKARVHGGVRIFVAVSYVAMLTIAHTSKSTYRLMSLLRNLWKLLASSEASFTLISSLKIKKKKTYTVILCWTVAEAPNSSKRKTCSLLCREEGTTGLQNGLVFFLYENSEDARHDSQKIDKTIHASNERADSIKIHSEPYLVSSHQFFSLKIENWDHGDICRSSKNTITPSHEISARVFMWKGAACPKVQSDNSTPWGHVESDIKYTTNPHSSVYPFPAFKKIHEDIQLVARMYVGA